MEIKRLQLRGISRAPSDRLTEDGGLSESLNMYLDTAENAPALVPEDVTTKIGLPEGVQADRIFIHKTASYRNILLYDSSTGTVSASIDGEIKPFYNAGQVTSLSFASVGNTLLVSTPSEVNYFLFKDSVYKSLGTQIPFPSFRFTAKHVDGLSLWESKSISFSIEEGSSAGNKSDFWLEQGEYTEKTWNEKNALTEEDAKKNIGTKAVNDVCKELAQTVYASAKENKVFLDHVFIRYAITLYDDSIISSVPYLMSGGYEDPLFVRYVKESYDWYKTVGESVVSKTYKAYNYETVTCKARYPYRIQAKLMDDLQIFDEWKDLIKSIDFYISEKGEPLFDEIFATTCKQQGTGEYAPYYSVGKGDPIVEQGITYYEWLKETKTYLFLSVGGPQYQDGFFDRLLDKSLFFKLESIGYKEKGSEGYASFVRRMTELHEGTELNTDDYFDSYDTLVDRDKALNGDDMLHSEIVWSQAYTFNNSLIASGVYENVGTGSTVITGAAVDIESMNALSKEASLESMFSNVNPKILPPENYSVTLPMTFTFIVQEDGREYAIKGRNEKGETLFVDENFSYYGYLVFPHRNCKKVIVGLDYGYQKEFSMKPHPMLDCSYAYIGLERNIAAEVSDWGEAMDLPEENRKIDKGNRIYVTTIDNPFYYPQEGIKTFQAKVLGVAVATSALSQGQFGQFPLYVFTEDGIWAMETAADGSFLTSKPLSREVCINPDSITSIDNAVVFITAKGVMMIQGSQVMDISPYMNGRHYIPNASAQGIIERLNGFSEFKNAITDETPFTAFMRDAKVAYDYTGKRLIFMSPDNIGYQYVYKIDTQTWHKIAFDNFDVVGPINSFPDCMIHCQREEKKTILVCLDNNSELNTEQLHAMVADFFPYDISIDKFGEFLEGKITFPIDGMEQNYIDEIVSILEVESVNTSTDEIVSDITYVYDFSTILDASRKQKTAKGILITRPFDLGMPDILKSVTNVRVRGDFDRDNVKFILQGSEDGRNFFTLNSLRGKSWTMFRLIILADLEPTERISWVDIQFEPRFSNRLR